MKAHIYSQFLSSHLYIWHQKKKKENQIIGIVKFQKTNKFGMREKI